MKNPPSEILEYLKTQRIGVFAIEMLDGSPHAATVHFAHTENPFQFYIETGIGCRKSEPLLKNSSARATLVIGTDENNMKTLQMDGIARITKDSENDFFINTILRNFQVRKVK